MRLGVGEHCLDSSLFTILSLLTEDVKISWQDAVADADRIHSARPQGDLGEGMTNTRAPLNHADSDMSNSGLETGRTVSAQPEKSDETLQPLLHLDPSHPCHPMPSPPTCPP